MEGDNVPVYHMFPCPRRKDLDIYARAMLQVRFKFF